MLRTPRGDPSLGPSVLNHEADSRWEGPSGTGQFYPFNPFKI